jgi:hypothetical protein
VKTALELTPGLLARCARISDHVTVSGLAPHVLALSWLLPQRVAGSQQVNERLAHLSRALRERCEHLYVRLPGSPSAQDIEDASSRDKTIELATAILSVQEDDAAACHDEAMPCVIGEIARDRVSALLFDLRCAPLGSVVPWIFFGELLGTSVAYRSTRSDALAPYRALLLERFTALAEQSPQIFWQSLVRGGDAALRERLRAFADAASGAKALAAIGA